jgi:hypothetical protein
MSAAMTPFLVWRRRSGAAMRAIRIARADFSTCPLLGLSLLFVLAALAFVREAS